MSSPEPLSVVIVKYAKDPVLKVGQPLIVRAQTRVIHEHSTAFLSDHFCRSARRRSPETWKTSAYLLCSWFEYLEQMEIDWHKASIDNLVEFQDAFASSICAQTGRPYDERSLTNRLNVVVAFYEYAALRLSYLGDLATSLVQREVHQRRPIDSERLVHTNKGRQRTKQTSAAREAIATRSSTGRIRPFSPSELQPFLASIGPRASEREEGENSRNRTLVDLGWAVGLRLDEIHGLTKYQFLTLTPDVDKPADCQTVFVKGKGSKGSGKRTRAVAIPNWLIIDVQAYIDTERKEALEASGISGRAESASLFVGSMAANKPGRPISRRRFQQIVSEACFASGLVDIVEHIDAQSGHISERQVARHGVHDLRHTYAVFTYWAESDNGNSEPWKKIQAQLGHSFLQTTINTYLQWTEIFKSNRATDIRSVLGFDRRTK